MTLSRALRLGRRGRPPEPTPGSVAPAAPELVAVDYLGADLHILAENKYERSWRAKAARREPWTVDWLESETRPGDTLYDIGANVGVFSLIAAALTRDRGLVVAFEPGYANYAHLCENIALNGMAAAVVPVPLALSSASGLQAFTYRSPDPGQSRHEFSATAWRPDLGASRKRYTQPMVSVALDDAIQLLHLPSPSLVKLDVDGAELHVLRGARETLANGSCRSLFVEIDDFLGDDVVSLLDSYGFRLADRHRRKKSSRVWHGTFRRDAAE
jgi:FkbM family methyltransferase